VHQFAHAVLILLLLLNPDRISDFIGDLFDYKKDITFDLKVAVTLSSNQQKLSASKKQTHRESVVKEHFDPNNHDFNFNHSSNTVEISTTSNDNLVKVLNKHLNITWAAFPYLETCLRTHHKSLTY
jgi:hypothetical protein